MSYSPDCDSDIIVEGYVSSVMVVGRELVRKSFSGGIASSLLKSYRHIRGCGNHWNQVLDYVDSSKVSTYGRRLFHKGLSALLRDSSTALEED